MEVGIHDTAGRKGGGEGGNECMYVLYVDGKECSSMLKDQRLMGDPCNQLVFYVCTLFLRVKLLCSSYGVM